MACEEIRELLPLHAGGETAANEQVAVEAHVGVCQDCRRELDEYRSSRVLLAELREGDAPPGTFPRIWEGVRSEVAPRKTLPLRLEWAMRAAAVLVLGLAIGYVASSRWPAAAARPDDAVAVDRIRGNGDARAHAIGGAPEPAELPSPALKIPLSPRAGTEFHLPRVEEVLDSGEIGF